MLQQPWELHPDLTANRLEFISRIAIRVWSRSKRAHQKIEGDTLWGLGTRFNERMRFALLQASEHEPWLRPILTKMHFVFCVGAVPARLYRGRADKPKRNYLERRTSEAVQQKLAFGGHFDAEVDWAYRVAVEAGEADARPVVKLVQHDTKTGTVGQVWQISGRALRRPIVVQELPKPTSNDNVTHVRRPVDQDAVKVTKKVKRAKASNDE